MTGEITNICDYHNFFHDCTYVFHFLWDTDIEMIEKQFFESFLKFKGIPIHFRTGETPSFKPKYFYRFKSKVSFEGSELISTGQIMCFIRCVAIKIAVLVSS